MNFLSFGTQVQYQRVGILQYLISHRHSLLYFEQTPKTFLRNFGIYQYTGCHTEGGNILTDHSDKLNASIHFRECKFVSCLSY
jgi:hypothetical protein